MTIRLGTRASALAQWQAEWVAARLRERGHEVELVLITTHGDTTQGPISKSNPGAPIGGPGSVGVFTKELQRALLDKQIDLAVHSLKDLPTDAIEGLTLAAVPQRESPFDVLVSRSGLKLEELPPGATIGTGSLRRRAQLLYFRPDLRMADIRGNVDSRLGKLREGRYDALVLAEAGLNRLGFSDQITQIFSPEMMLPAVGQGALGLETRDADRFTMEVVGGLDHPATRHAVLAERSLLFALAGGCLAPIGALATVDAAGSLSLRATVLAADGRTRIVASGESADTEWDTLAVSVAGELLRQGSVRLIEKSRQG